MVLIAVGSELLRRGRRETHSDYLTSVLEEAGLEVASRRIVPDRVDEIVAELVEARRRGGLILMTGGIGPTRDDCTREALARALGRPLRVDLESRDRLRAWCRRYRFPYTSDQARQTLIPTGARAIPNRLGSAPGIWYSDRRGTVVVLPGVFPELSAMLRPLLARLRKLGGAEVAGATLLTAGRGESVIDARIAPLSRAIPGVEVTTLASPGEVTIQLRGRGRGATARVTRFVREIARRLGADLVSTSGETLEEKVLALLNRRRLRVATAESCTAGLVSARITSVPGSSRAFLGGAVCYNDRSKVRVLSVPEKILKTDGAVSRRTALAMARGAARLMGAEVAVAVTGIAGPGGGTPRKPVGTVHWAVVGPDGYRIRSRCLSGGREKIRRQAAALALDLVRRTLLPRARRSSPTRS